MTRDWHFNTRFMYVIQLITLEFNLIRGQCKYVVSARSLNLISNPRQESLEMSPVNGNDVYVVSIRSKCKYVVSARFTQSGSEFPSGELGNESR